MTRKDYIFLAEVFNAALKQMDKRLATHDLTVGEFRMLRRGGEDMARAMAAALAKETPRFDQHLFLQNAGVRSFGI